jgi:hypothetical protein
MIQISSIVKQTVLLSDNIITRNVTLSLINNDIELNFQSDDVFSEFDDSKSKFELIVEFNSNLDYKIWDLNLKVNDLEIDDFIIEKNNDYHDLLNFLNKINLNSLLNNSLQSKSIKKRKKI